MKVEISKQDFLQAIAMCSRAVNVRSQQPILSCMKFVPGETSITVVGYDLETGISCTVPATVSGDGALAIPSKNIVEISKKLPDDLIVLDGSDPKHVRFRCGSIKCSILGQNAEEYPSLPPSGAQTLNLHSSLLRDLIRRTAFAASTSDIRPILLGVNIQMADNILTFSATDQFRLSRKIAQLNDATASEFNVVVQGKSLIELSRFIPDKDTLLSLSVTQSHFIVSWDNVTFYSRLLQGEFPDVTRIIPNMYSTVLIYDAAPLLDALERSVLVSKDNEHYKVTWELGDKDLLRVSAYSSKFGNIEEDLVVHQIVGEPLTMTFNGKYMIDALQSLGDVAVRIEFPGQGRPFVIRVMDDDSHVQLISPLRA